MLCKTGYIDRALLQKKGYFATEGLFGERKVVLPKKCSYAKEPFCCKTRALLQKKGSFAKEELLCKRRAFLQQKGSFAKEGLFCKRRAFLQKKGSFAKEGLFCKRLFCKRMALCKVFMFIPLLRYLCGTPFEQHVLILLGRTASNKCAPWFVGRPTYCTWLMSCDVLVGVICWVWHVLAPLGTPHLQTNHFPAKIIATQRASEMDTLQRTATYCNTLQHTATHCNVLQHTATPYNVPQHTATHCNTLQHTTRHRNDATTTCAAEMGFIWDAWNRENVSMHLATLGYRVATISRLLKIVGLFCRISSLL